MRGAAYPGAFLQQNAGAIVRAIPGVKDVRFAVQIEPPHRHSFATHLLEAGYDIGACRNCSSTWTC
jgi:site-specific recombinase XerD